jgi:hypothetical protein
MNALTMDEDAFRMRAWAAQGRDFNASGRTVDPLLLMLRPQMPAWGWLGS